MIIQDVNLYRRSLSNKPNIAKRRRVQATAALLIFAVVGYTGFSFWDAWYWSKSLRDSMAEYTIVNGRLSELKAQLLAVEEGDVSLSISAIERRISETKRRRVALETYLGEDSIGFSGYFSAFSRQHINGLWLTHINIDTDRSNVVFAGRSIDPALIPKYISRLAREGIFKGVTFHSFRIKQPQDDDETQPEYVEFMVSSQELSDIFSGLKVP